MRRHYDFSSARKNPYAKRLKKQIPIRFDETTLATKACTAPADRTSQLPCVPVRSRRF